MDLSMVKQIFETRDMDACNAHLAIGWVLLDTASMTTNSKDYTTPVIKYALGWVRDGLPAKPPNRYI